MQQRTAALTGATSAIVASYISSDEAARLRKRAAAAGRSVSAEIRLALRAHLGDRDEERD